MAHCPQCGETTPDGARACPFCGTQLAVRAPVPASRTMVGVALSEVAGSPAAPPAPPAPIPAPPAGAPRANHTIVGMPRSAVTAMAEAPAPRTRTVPEGSPPLAPPAGAPLRVGQTMVGVGLDGLSPGPMPTPLAPRAGAPRAPAGGTLVGVARPGIAPLNPGNLPPLNPGNLPPSEPPPPAPAPVEPPPPGYEPARELGATMGPVPEQILAGVRDKERERDRRRRMMVGPPVPKAQANKPARREDDRSSRKALALVLSAGGLALVAVIVALFWPSPPPLQARARADEKGREGVELTCKSCPDGTKLTIGGASAVTAAGVALVPLPTALSVGDNRFKVEIDRPGSGRDEVVSINVNVAYRIRPDLGTLSADKPSFQIVAEVAEGTTVTIDGRKLSTSGGHGVENVDVTDVCTGLSGEVKTLSRQIPYTVTPTSGPPEQGAVNISVGIVPLRLEAPVATASAALPPHVITDGPSFVLAGSTLKGAEVIAAGRPITVHPDGSFAQVMNVSSVGATQIEVRARMPGMAPRLTQIKVRRVESLEKAAKELASSDPPVPFAQLAADIPGSVGKAVALTGEVSESKKQGYETVMLLEVSPASGCAAGSSCTIRLLQGADNPAKRGDVLRVFGHVARPFSIPGRPDIPEIEVDFTLKGDAGASPKPATAGARDRR